jgi:predicted Fe-Mo cluster-binding NifX family protein
MTGAMKKTNDRAEKNCFNPWFNFMLIFSVAALTLVGIVILDRKHVNVNMPEFAKRSIKVRPVDNVLIAADGHTPTSPVAVQFETSPYFLIVPEKGGQYEEFSNSGARFNQSAMLEFVLQNKIEAVITGTMEIGTFQALNANRIEVFTGVKGSVQDAMKKFRKDQLVTYSWHYHSKHHNTAHQQRKSAPAPSGQPVPVHGKTF